jgi:hypothetical protein
MRPIIHATQQTVFMASPDRFFLFIGDADSDAAVSRLKAARVLYRKKQLNSKPENWRKIVGLLREPGLRGVVGTLNAHNYDQLLDPRYSGVSDELLVAVAQTSHVFFVHEQVLTGEEIPVQPPPVRTRSGWYDEPFARDFGAPEPAVRAQVAALFDQRRINVLPYRTNAERAVLAAAFIEDHERDLLLRVYVPHGRLYADEMDRLLGLFRDWLNQVRHHTVRQDGYTTAAGRVYEFVGDGSLSPDQLRTDMEAFHGFLDLCAARPEAAERQLLGEGVDPAGACRLASRYGKEKRRLDIDLRHARDSRLLDLRRDLESELVDAGDGGQTGALSGVLEQLLPATTGRGALDSRSGAARSPRPRARARCTSRSTNRSSNGSKEPSSRT